MSILIKGMEMPECCALCRIKRRNGKKVICPLLDEEWDIHDPMSAYHRLDNCPLVPVPAHGRLIDADAAIANRNKDTNWCYDLCDLPEYLSYCPTIIPAEEGET